MTDNEIKRALECCEIAYDQDCTECPLYPDDGEIACREVLREEALDLITRQQCEIVKCKCVIQLLKKDVANAKSEAYKEFADLSIKRICEEVSAPTPSESYIAEKCNQAIDNLVKEMVGENNA